MREPEAVYVADRFPALRVQLLEVLLDLSVEEWSRPTAARLWSVKDVAAHLLGGDIGNLSRRRDKFTPADRSIQGHRDFVSFLNDFNELWVRAARRMSPRVLCDLLAFTGPQMEEYFSCLEPDGMGGPVSWAGPEPAPVWFDVAREFTERWHHQQQIRDATNRAPLYEPYFLQPVLATFVRALPHSFRDIAAHEGTIVKFQISGEAGGTWFLMRGRNAWRLLIEVDEDAATEVRIAQDAAWRLFTRGIDRDEACALASVRGDRRLAEPVFATLAVIA